MTGRSALILGTLAGQVDAVEALRSRGWTVYTCGHRAEGPGVEAADEFFLVDVLDVAGVSALAARLGVDVVYSVGSDIAMPTVARVSEALGLASFHSAPTTDLLHSKVMLRDFLATAELSPVSYQRLQSVEDAESFTHYPAILKPTDSQGQRGITYVDSYNDVQVALPSALAASQSKTAILEERLEGPEVSVHVFVIDGSIRFFLPSDRLVWAGPLIGIPEAHILPSSWLDESAAEDVRRLIDLFVSRLQITNGPLYFQLILTGDGPRIVEVAPRLDGCHLWRLIREHTGFDLMTTTFDLLVGGEWQDPDPWQSDVGHALWFYLVPVGEPVKHAELSDTGADHTVFEEFQVADGALPRDTNGVVARAGYRIEVRP